MMNQNFVLLLTGFFKDLAKNFEDLYSSDCSVHGQYYLPNSTIDSIIQILYK